MFHINKEVKIFFNYVIGPLLGAWLFYSLYQQIRSQPHLHLSILKIKDAIEHNSLRKILLIIAMVFINWGMEARKWQLLVRMIQPISLYTAFKGVLSGVALSINTPNRVGEYGGRILFINEGNRLRAISLSVAGSLSQLIITLAMGAFSIIYILLIRSSNVEYIMGLSIFWLKILCYLSFLSAIIIGIFFFRISAIFKYIDRISFLVRYRYFLETLQRLSPNLLLRLLSLSFFRYLVFVIQYILLMQVMEIDISLLQGFWSVSLLYLVLAIVPSIAIAELGIRGKFSVAILGLFTSNIVGIMGSTFGIWFLNLFIPAITGSIFIIVNRFFKENNSRA